MTVTEPLMKIFVVDDDSPRRRRSLPPLPISPWTKREAGGGPGVANPAGINDISNLQDYSNSISRRIREVAASLRMVTQ